MELFSTIVTSPCELYHRATCASLRNLLRKQVTMKIKMIIAAILLAGVSFAQTSNPSKSNSSAPQNSAAAQAQAKSSCSCCDKMADGKNSDSCCGHHDETMKSEMSCCQDKDGKEAMSCAKGDGCCEGKKCARDQKACCDHPSQGSEQTKMSCCGGSHEHDGMAHGHCAMMDGHDNGDMSK